MDYLIMALMTVFSPLIMLCILGINMFVLSVIGWVFEQFEHKQEQAPYCDIDPLCHPGFIWDGKGNGFINGIMVISSGIKVR